MFYIRKEIKDEKKHVKNSIKCGLINHLTQLKYNKKTVLTDGTYTYLNELKIGDKNNEYYKYL